MKFIFTGDIKHAGRVEVEAGNKEEAHDKLKKGDFKVYEEESRNLEFDWDEGEVERDVDMNDPVYLKQVLDNLVQRGLIKDTDGDHMDEIREILNG